MSATRIGKIARLPKHVRDDLGRRLEDGEPGKELVKWLNSLPGVQRVLKEQFEEREITEQNLSAWKNDGGHQDWLRQEEMRLLVASVTEQHRELEDEADGIEISDRFASMFAAELICVIRSRLEMETDPEKRWKIICEAHRELSQLRRDGHRAVRTHIRRERWDREIEREAEGEEQRLKQEEKKRLRGIIFSVLKKKTVADLFGGGEQGEKMAEMLHRIEFDLPLDDLVDPKSSGKTGPDEIKPNPDESGPIQPNTV